MENRVHVTEMRTAASLDPFTFYKTYLDTNIPLLGDQEDLESEDDGHTCCARAAAAHDATADDAQPQAGGHTAAYKLAVRLANRSNGAPLATIIEQGSYSTLTSRGSLLSVGRFPSLKAAENTSPNYGPRRRSRSLDEKFLHDILEDSNREHGAFMVAVPLTELDEEYGAADPVSGTATPLTAYPFELQQSPSSQSGDVLLDQDHSGVKTFIRGVLQNVRGVQRPRSRSSSKTYMLTTESPISASTSTSQLDQEHGDLGSNESQINARSIVDRASQGAGIPPVGGDQTRVHASSRSRGDSSAYTHLPSSQSRSSVKLATSVSDRIPAASPCQAATRSHERPFSTPIARSGTRDVPREKRTNQASTPHNDMHNISAPYTFAGVSLPCGNDSLLRGTSSGREVFASQNASFCSTMSTSYSGTVVGVDLDLQHDFRHALCRSQSPPTPVWFTPQMTELERQASFSESPELEKVCNSAHATCRSITSSALTSLLPIAAASGIVRPNYNTPKISFYSPSGNLIQPENSSPQGSSVAEYGGSPMIATCYYNKQNNKQNHCEASSSSESLPIRSPLVTMTVPPSRKTPLPPHLQYRHNHSHPEGSQVSSRESLITPKGPVKGCDGVIRENSLTPRSGVLHPHGRDRDHRSTKLAMHDLKAEVKFYKARFTALAAAQGFAPALPKGKTLRKRHAHNYNTYAKKPPVSSTDAARPPKGGYREDDLGPLAAHALRVCFCQPYDGAGKPTRATAANARLTGEPLPFCGWLNADHEAKDAEPNVRVVSSGRRSECGDAKRRRGETTRYALPLGEDRKLQG